MFRSYRKVFFLVFVDEPLGDVLSHHTKLKQNSNLYNFIYSKKVSIDTSFGKRKIFIGIMCFKQTSFPRSTHFDIFFYISVKPLYHLVTYMRCLRPRITIVLHTRVADPQSNPPKSVELAKPHTNRYY